MTQPPIEPRIAGEPGQARDQPVVCMTCGRWRTFHFEPRCRICRGDQTEDQHRAAEDRLEREHWDRRAR